jgi:RNA polymerase sigma factor (sigma-70 family)
MSPPPPTRSRREALVLLEDRDGLELGPVDGDCYSDWESAYLDNVARIYRLLYSKVGNRPDAEDLTSEVFRASLRPLDLAASKGEVRAYLYATARTVLASHWRRHLGVEVTRIDPDTDADIGYGAAAPADPGTDRRAERILAALPDRYRRLLELRFLQSCSIKEAAHTMNISETNAKVLQHRALRRAARIAQEQAW